MALFVFLVEVFGISFSGAAQPGPITAAAIAMGSRNRYAGARLALGHAIIEFPVMLLIFFGLSKFLESAPVRIVIGLAGGIILLVMALQMFISTRPAQDSQHKAREKNPVLAGIILSAGNPYFLLWWATVGLALATDARGFETWAYGLFIIVHWACDLLWVQALSWASFKGTRLLGERSGKIALQLCSLALFFFGLLFIYGAAGKLAELI